MALQEGDDDDDDDDDDDALRQILCPLVKCL
jgi:hypothetical protein